MITINSINENYFTLNSNTHAKIYQPLKMGLNAIGIYNVYDTKLQLLNSTDYSEFTINGNTYNSQADVIAALLPVIYKPFADGDFTTTNWGDIEGNITNQIDLMALMNTKANEADLGLVAFTNDYNSLTNLPTIPTGFTPTIPTLQEVTDSGSTTTNSIIVDEIEINKNGNYVLNFGKAAGTSNTGDNVTNIGDAAGTSNTGDDVLNVGAAAGNENSGNNVVNVGTAAGIFNTFDKVINFGNASKANRENQITFTIDNKDLKLNMPTSNAELAFRNVNGTVALLSDLSGLTSANIYNSAGSIPQNTIRNISLESSSIINFESESDGGALQIANNGTTSRFDVNTHNIGFNNDSIRLISYGTDKVKLEGKRGLELKIGDSSGNTINPTVGQVLTAIDTDGGVKWSDAFHLEGYSETVSGVTGQHLIKIGDVNDVYTNTKVIIDTENEFIKLNAGNGVFSDVITLGIDENVSNPYNAKLNVNSDIVTTNGNEFPILNTINKRNSTNSLDLVYGISNLVEHDGDGNISQLRGIHNRVRSDGAGSPDIMLAQNNNVSYRNIGSENITLMSASDNYVDIEDTVGSGTIKNVIGTRGNVKVNNENVKVVNAFGGGFQLELEKGTVDNFVGVHIDIDQSAGTTLLDGNYLEFGTGIDLAQAQTNNIKVIESFVDLPSEFAGTIEAKELSIINGTSDDILLGDGSIASLSALTTSSATLQDVTDNGNVTTTPIKVPSISFKDGYTNQYYSISSSIDEVAFKRDESTKTFSFQVPHTGGGMLKCYSPSGSYNYTGLYFNNPISNEEVIVRNEGGTMALLSDIPQKYTELIGDGSTTGFTINHTLGTDDVIVQVLEVATGEIKTAPQRFIDDANNVTVVFKIAPTTDEYKVLVFG